MSRKDDYKATAKANKNAKTYKDEKQDSLTEKKDKMNTAILVLLSSTAIAEDKIQELPHLNIFDEEQIK